VTPAEAGEDWVSIRDMSDGTSWKLSIQTRQT